MFSFNVSLFASCFVCFEFTLLFIIGMLLSVFFVVVVVYALTCNFILDVPPVNRIWLVISTHFEDHCPLIYPFTDVIIDIVGNFSTCTVFSTIYTISFGFHLLYLSWCFFLLAFYHVLDGTHTYTSAFFISVSVYFSVFP